MVHYTKQEEKQNWSDVLTQTLPYEYTYLSALFSSVEGTTIEQYIIHQRIEKVKELIFYHCCPVKINSKFKKVHLSQMTGIMIQ